MPLHNKKVFDVVLPSPKTLKKPESEPAIGDSTVPGSSVFIQKHKSSIASPNLYGQEQADATSISDNAKRVSNIAPVINPVKETETIASESEVEAVSVAVIDQHPEEIKSTADRIEETTTETEPVVTQADDGQSPEPETVDNKFEVANKDDAKDDHEAPAPGPRELNEVFDSLPDSSAILKTQLTDNMQAPFVYDTKEYIVPIKNTKTSNNKIGPIIAGIFSALIALAVIAFLAYKMV